MKFIQLIKGDLMKKLITLFTSFVLLFILIPINGIAATLDKLPSSQSSEQWKVVIGEPDADKPELNKSEHGVFNVFSLDIKNLGKDNINLVRVEAYRNDPHSKTEFGLFTFEDNMLPQSSFHLHNFPLAMNAQEITVSITWTKKGSHNKKERKYREQFVYIQK